MCCIANKLLLNTVDIKSMKLRIFFAQYYCSLMVHVFCNSKSRLLHTGTSLINFTILIQHIFYLWGTWYVHHYSVLLSFNNSLVFFYQYPIEGLHSGMYCLSFFPFNLLQTCRNFPGFLFCSKGINCKTETNISSKVNKVHSLIHQ